MANSSIQIRDKITQKLALMQTIKSVVDHASSDLNGEYPSAEVFVGSGSAEVVSNVHSLAAYPYAIRVSTEFGTNFSPQKAERIVNEIVDEVLTAFRADLTLSGLVQYIDQLEYEGTFDSREHDVRVIEFTLTAHKIESINSTLP